MASLTHINWILIGLYCTFFGINGCWELATVVKLHHYDPWLQLRTRWMEGEAKGI